MSKTRTFTDGDFKISIAERKDSYMAYLCRKDIGIKEFMFGAAKEQPDCIYYPDGKETMDDFIETVEANLSFEEAYYNNTYAPEEKHTYRVSEEYAEELGLTENDMFTFDEFCKFAKSIGECTNHIFWMFEEVTA